MGAMTTLTSRVPLLLGTAATALLLAACGANEVGEPEGTGSQTPLATPIVATPTSSATGVASPTPGLTNQPSASTSGGPSAGEASSDAGAELEVEDQRGDGRTVAVQEAKTTSGTGFVAVYRGDQLLGSVPVGSGALTVQLDTPVPATGELEAVLFADDGDGQLDAAKDSRLEDEDFDYTLQ
jgi:hypothetical protein